MNRFWLKTGVLAATAACSLTAFAQSSTTAATAGTSVTNAEVTAPKAKELPIQILTSSTLNGPRVNTPTDNKITGASDDREAFEGIYTREQLGVKYIINEKTSIKPTVDFNYRLTDPTPAKNNRQFHWRDSYVNLSRTGVIEETVAGNAAAMDLGLRAYVPTSQSSRDNNTLGGARLALYPSLEIGKTGFSLSNESYARYWFQQHENNDKGKSLIMAELYTGPQLNYAVNDKVNAFVLFEAIVDYDKSGMPTNSTDPKASQCDFEPGVDLKLHKNVTVSPFLNWYTNQPMYTTTLNINASIRLL